MLSRVFTTVLASFHCVLALSEAQLSITFWASLNTFWKTRLVRWYLKMARLSTKHFHIAWHHRTQKTKCCTTFFNQKIFLFPITIKSLILVHESVSFLWNCRGIISFSWQCDLMSANAYHNRLWRKSCTLLNVDSFCCCLK